MPKIDLEKLVTFILREDWQNAGFISHKSICRALKEQGLEYKDGQIVEIKQESEEIKPKH